MKFKKTTLVIGSIATVATPIASVVSCGGNNIASKVRHFNVLPTYTGQADQLLALGIHSDYYPLQLSKDKMFNYLLNPGHFMVEQSKSFKDKFTKAIKGLTPKIKGPSWWNQDAQNSDDKRADGGYWQKQEGTVLLYEHYLLDDNSKIIDKSQAPKHNNQTTIQTNFRASRDPYTRLPKGVFYGWDLSNKTLSDIIKGKVTESYDQPNDNKSLTSLSAKGSKSKGVVITNNIVKVTLNNDSHTIDKASAQIIIAMRKKRSEFLGNKNQGTSDWFYNDWFFVDSFHRMFLDNEEFQNSPFKDWIIDSTKESPFTTSADRKNNSDADKDIKSLFDASTYTEVEVQNKISPTSHSTPKPHHPIYEQQEGQVGAAPMFEGAMRDNQLYLFNVAWQMSNLVNTGSPYGEQFIDELPDKVSLNASDSMTARSKEEAKIIKDYIKKHVSPTQLAEMKNALSNANSITKELKQRMSDMKDYFAALKLNGKTFGMITIAPGHGVSTIQSMSKYSFIYKELGFAQPLPKNLHALAEGAREFNKGWNGKTNTNLKGGEVSSTSSQSIKDAIGKGSSFNMDDNGWFWNIGDTKNVNSGKLQQFKGVFDLGVVAAHDTNYKAEATNNSGMKKGLQDIFKNKANLDSYDLTKGGVRVDYDLWNEGIKTPFVMHMVLDQIMAVAEKNIDAATLKAAESKRSKAVNWGKYFTDTFVNKK